MKIVICKIDFNKFKVGDYLYISQDENDTVIIVSEKDMKDCKPSDYAEIFLRNDKTDFFDTHDKSAEILRIYKRFTNYFYTDKELRKLKLQKINEESDIF